MTLKAILQKIFFAMLAGMENTNAPVPEWANFFNAAQYHNFLLIVATYFKERNLDYSLADAVIVPENDFADDAKLGLVNLAQLCSQFNKEEWKNIIVDHFEGMRKAAVFEREFAKQAHNFDYAKEYIAVRLYPNDYVNSIEDKLAMGKQLTEQIFATLVFDFPDSIVNVRPEQTIQWGKDNEELFETGVDNVRSKYKSVSTPLGDDDVQIILFHANHFYVPNIAFDLQGNVALVGLKGALVGLPNRHSALIYRIESMLVTEAISKMIVMISKGYTDGPGSLSKCLYWFDGSNFINLPYELGSDSIDFTPPDNFMEMLNSLE